MFGKCLKHEFRATARQLTPLFIAMLAVSLLAGLFLGIGERMPESEGYTAVSILSSFFSGILAVALIALIVAVAIVAFVMIIRRFYTSFFSDEGYLTFTLPVTTDEHLLSKFVTAYLWQALASILSVVCVFLMLFVMFLVGGIDLSGSITAEDQMLLEEFLYMLGMEAGEGFLPLMLVLVVISVMVGLAASVFMIYLSISIACMIAKKHRVIAGIVSYYLINMIFSTISSFAGNVLVYVEEDGSQAMMISMIIAIVLSVIQALACFLGTRWILSKKINLD